MSRGLRGHRADSKGVSIRRLYARTLESPYIQGAVTQARPTSDPGFQAALATQSFQDSSRLGFGVITDVTAIANCYRVQLDKMHYPLTGMLAGPTAAGASGARPLNTLQPGTPVVVAWHPNLYYCVILGAMPYPQTAGNKSVHEQICHASRNRVDQGHQQPLIMGGRPFVTDWLSGRPFDATAAGEAGWIAETGMRIFMDPFMAMLGLDEATGLTVFYQDQLMRIAAYNLRMFTAGHEREGINDGCEYNDWSGFTPYPWEQMGLYTRGQDPRRDHTPAEWQVDVPYLGPWEPEPLDARAWHRVTLYQGYFGQGGKKTVCVAPTTGTRAKFTSDQPVYPCLYDEMTTLDGRHIIASAKGIHIVKRSGLIAPQRKYVPEQIKTEGDSDKDYKFASIEGSGPEHEIKGGLKINGSPAALVRAATVHDLHAYLFNYVSFHGMYWHTKDWDCPEQSDLTHVDGKPFTVPDFGQLAYSMFLEPPSAKSVKVDHRYDKTEIFPNDCGMDFLDDGGVVFYDGFGGEIRMTGGSIMKPGRNANIWGGDDVIVKAKNSMDFSTSNKDMRFKAERNQQFLSGNSGIGGTLIESKGAKKYNFVERKGEEVESGGVMLRAPIGDVTTWASRVYLRTGGGKIAPGPIILDANKGMDEIITHALVQHHFLDGSFFIHYGREGEMRESLMLNENYSAIPSTLFVDGAGIFANSVLCKGSFLASGGHIVTTQGCNNMFVGCLKNPGKVNLLIAEGKERVNESLPTDLAKPKYDNKLDDEVYEEDQVGNDDVIANASFTCRTVDQYGTMDFQMFEDRWQQQGRMSKKVTTTWPEAVVVTEQGDMYPYPGDQHYAEGSKVLMQIDMKLVDFDNDRERDRGASPNLNDEYKNPETEEPDAVSLNSYLVIH